MTRIVLHNVLPTILMLSFAPAGGLAHEALHITFETDDSVPIVADYWTPVLEGDATQAPVAILLHMYRSDRSAWKPLVPALEKAGFAVLALDLRGHGESTGPAARSFPQRVLDRDPALFNAMHRDVAAAHAWLKGRSEVDLDHVVVAGASVGCSVAIDYARRNRGVDAIALLTPGASYLAVDSLAHVSDLGPQTRVLMLSSREEAELGVLPLCTRLAPSAAEPLNAAVASLAARKVDEVTLQVPRTPPAVPLDVVLCAQGSVHGTQMFGKVAGVEDRIAAFLKAAVTPTPTPAATAP